MEQIDRLVALNVERLSLNHRMLDTIGSRLAQRKAKERNFRELMSNLREFIQFQKGHWLYPKGCTEYEQAFGGYNPREGMWMRGAWNADGTAEHKPIAIRRFY